MGAKLLRHPEERFSRDEFVVFDDFDYYVSGERWTSLAADTNTVVAHEGPGRGRVSVSTGPDNVNNDEAAVATTNELFKFIANKAIVAEGLVQFAEAATNAANVAFGFADAFGANLIADNGGAVGINDSGALIFKRDGETVWSFQTEIGGTAVTTQSTTTAGGSAAQTLRIEITPVSSSVFEARPFVDGVQLVDTNGNPIMHRITLGTSTDMDFGLYVKCGSSLTQVVYADYLYASQGR